MSKLLVFGHKSPDTDTIASAIALSYLLNEVSIEAEAVALGEPNGETEYALNYFKTEAPRVIETAANEVEEVVLVDHNEAQQSVSDIKDVTIKAVVDHHRIANFETTDPLYMRIEPVGCTSTILLKLYKEYNVEIPSNIAGLMLSAIISDTLLMKSPTSTLEDAKAAEELAAIAGVSLEEYGLEMLKAGTNISTKTPFEILNDDAKTFEMSGEAVRIGQVNVVDVDDILHRKTEILEAIKEEVRVNNYDLFVLLVTDIIENNSIAIVEGPAYRHFEMAFNKPIQLNTVELENIVSRKKQVVPTLTEVFKRD